MYNTIKKSRLIWNALFLPLPLPVCKVVLPVTNSSSNSSLFLKRDKIIILY